MSGADLENAYRSFKQEVDREHLKKISVKIISMSQSEMLEWEKSQFWQWCTTESIQISFLKTPCKLTTMYTENNKKYVAESEVKWVFAENMWKRVNTEPVAGSICISHLRALQEVFEENPGVSMILILEGDVETTKNTVHNMCNLIANWFCNRELEYCEYIALCSSDWHIGYSRDLSSSPKIRNSKIGPFFQLVCMPSEEGYQGSGFYKFIGQGARAIVYSSNFATHILGTKVQQYWDLHLIGQLSHLKKSWHSQGFNTKALALVSTPTIFTHVPTMADRFRGSGRLHSLRINDAEPDSKYICLDLSKNYGLANRMQTIVLWCMVCTVTELGLIVLWEKSTACNCNFDDFFFHNIGEPPSAAMPFLRIIDNAKNHMWAASMKNPLHCVAHFHSQCQVEDGYNYMLNEWKKHCQKHDTAVTRHVKNVLEDLQAWFKGNIMEFWKLFDVADRTLFNDCEAYFQSEGFQFSQVGWTYGFHIRRGDFKKTHYKDPMTNNKTPYPVKLQLKKEWKDSDDEFMAALFFVLFPLSIFGFHGIENCA